MKKWFHKIDIHTYNLEEELNAFSKQGYEVYKLWRIEFNIYEIVVYKEVSDGN